MDSGNSGSIQSSSGGDEEYDSRAESISAFLNPTGHIGPMTNPPQQPPPPHHHHHHNPNSSMFDPLSNYFDPLGRPSPPPLANPSSLLNLDTVWSKTVRFEPNCTEINPILASPSAVPPFFGSQAQPRGPYASSSSSVSFPPAAENTTPRGSSSSSATTDQAHAVRNPKKRSRASRRAPTTVLTTDTTNFRSMVQEFTGIPAPPFTSSSFPRSRLDLFGTPSSMRSSPLDASQPPYLLRPFAQKFQPPPFVSPSSSSPSPSSSSLSPSLFSSSMVDGIASTSTNNLTSVSSTPSVSNSTSVNYRLPSELGLLKQPQGLLNMQTPILTFQSLLQSAPKYPLANQASLGTKTQGSLEIPSNDSHLKMGVLDEFGLSHGHVNHMQLTGTTRNDNNQTSWADGMGSNNTDQSHLRLLDGNYDYSQCVTNGKLNYSASSSNFHGEKGSVDVPTRGEGMVESWMCSSD